MAGSSPKPEEGKKKARIEIIPLIDVIFFLLATFVLFTLSLKKLVSIPVQLPVAQAQAESKPDLDLVTLQMSDQGACYWKVGQGGSELIPIAEIAPKLNDLTKVPGQSAHSDYGRHLGEIRGRGPRPRRGAQGRHPAGLRRHPATASFRPITLFTVARAQFPMRRDLIIGVIVSASVIFGSAWISEITKGGKPKPKPAEIAPTIEVIQMPKLEPDEPEVVEDNTQPMADLAPPMLNDVPQLVTDTSFVQALQPTPPDNMAINKNLLTIPPNTGSWGKGIQVFDPSQLDQQPVPTVQARPTYPFEMRRAGISGSVTVDFIVDVGGQVHNAFAASSSQREFEAAAVQAVSKWRFKAGRRGGRAVNTHMQVPIVFTLNTDE